MLERGVLAALGVVAALTSPGAHQRRTPRRLAAEPSPEAEPPAETTVYGAHYCGAKPALTLREIARLQSER